jgi:histone H3
VEALSEIRKYQQAGGLLMHKLPFQRLCREVMDVLINAAKSRRDVPPQFQSIVIMALQQATEAYLVGLFEDVILLVIQHCKRVTIQIRDMTFAMRIHNEAKNKVLNELKSSTYWSMFLLVDSDCLNRNHQP